MKVVLFGASGMVGSRVLQELIFHGHQITAVVRDPSKLEAGAGVKIVKGDALDAASVAEVSEGADAVISAYSPGNEPPKIVDATKALISGMQKAGVKRFIEVGGAGSLFVAPGKRLADTPGFPEEYKAIAIAHGEALDVIRTADLDWTYFSPAAVIQPGERIGTFRLDKDNLVVDEKGNSSISAEDYAIALVDELENPRHIRQRFTIGY